MTRDDIITQAGQLRHGWIITDALSDDDKPDLEAYTEMIKKIKSIEENYTDDEILANNILCDIW